MSLFGESLEKLRKDVTAIFENDEYVKDLQTDNTIEDEFDFSGEVNYRVKVEDDGEEKEFYVFDEDGQIVEIFTSAMAGQDGRIPAAVRQDIVSQYGEDDDDVVSDDVDDDDDNGDEEEVDVDDSDDSDDGEEVPEGDSTETPESDSEELAESEEVE